MNDRGIVLLSADPAIEARAKAAKLPVVVDPEMPLAFDKTLFVEGVGVPWDLLPAAWHFLERWDAAVPLWRYGANADSVGTPSERERTQAVVRDLRVLLYAHELLFLRKNEAGEALRAAFLEERGTLPSPEGARLAFLRAYYRVKPRMCVLPRSWLAKVQARAKATPTRAGKRGRKASAKTRLIQIEIGPGQFVRCLPENVEQVRAQFARRRRRRAR